MWWKLRSLLKQYPGLKIGGFRNGYFKEGDWDNVSEEIKRESDFVFVGITLSLKRVFNRVFARPGHCSVFMGVGGSFDVISGRIPRAPLWMQKMNLEWLFRVIQEPKRLFKRYFVGNTVFIQNVLTDKVKRLRT